MQYSICCCMFRQGLHGKTKRRRRRDVACNVSTIARAIAVDAETLTGFKTLLRLGCRDGSCTRPCAVFIEGGCKPRPYSCHLRHFLLSIATNDGNLFFPLQGNLGSLSDTLQQNLI
ncbi:MAG: hypothetical protein LBR08_01410 [Bacteroidales bacterium]|jgi:hypothetical protein|nr:hypothetical protein [Bacteroidales bacterium]